VASVSFIEILAERGEKGIGQNDRFVMVQSAHVRIGQMNYLGTTRRRFAALNRPLDLLIETPEEE
jgi:hypothetical protein